MDQNKFSEFNTIFYPRSVAVAGASKDRMKMGSFFLSSLIGSDYEGQVYPVNSDGNQVLGMKSYRRIRDIPGSVDYVIVSVPAISVLQLLEDCAAKGVKTVHIFTAGFRESGTAEGRKLEREIVKRAREGGFHIIGPNSLGICNSSSSFIPLGLPMEGTGPVAILAQSGSVTARSAKRGLARGIQFSKVVSYGNGSDLDSTDFLEYFAEDPDTGIIGMYIEGINDGQRLFCLLRDICKSKPVVVWKGGKTGDGAEVALSHTGSLAVTGVVWNALSKQVGMIEVDNIEEFVDALLTLYCLGEFLGDRMGILCGLLGGGGGEGVSATDLCTSNGLKVSRFSESTREKLTAVLPAAGRIFRNPLDFGTPVENLEILRKALDAVAADPGVDLIIFHYPVDELCTGPFGGWAQDINNYLLRLKREQPKPVVVISTPGLPPAPEQWALESELNAARIPVYPNMQRAARAIAGVSRYFKLRELNENQ